MMMMIMMMMMMMMMMMVMMMMMMILMMFTCGYGSNVDDIKVMCCTVLCFSLIVLRICTG